MSNKKQSTLDLYKRALDKIGVSRVEDLTNRELIIDRINSLSSKSYKILALRAINNLCVSNNIEFTFCKEYKDLVRENTEVSSETLPITLAELKSIEVKCKEPLRQLVESFTVWINVNHPLRLDYYNVEINPSETSREDITTNYMTWQDLTLTFYLNDFKNVHSFGSQVLTYSHPIICNYIQELTLHFGSTPKYLLYRYDIPTGTLKTFSSREMYGGYLKELFKRHTGKEITMNTIRKIHESDLIQSDKYSKMTTSEKKEMHRKLLHSLATAHESYNVI